MLVLIVLKLSVQYLIKSTFACVFYCSSCVELFIISCFVLIFFCAFVVVEKFFLYNVFSMYWIYNYRE